MRNTIKLFSIIVLIAIIGFSFTACGGNGNGYENGTDPGLFSVSGNFTKTNGDEVLFNLAAVNTPTKSTRSLADITSIAISGELLDGDIIFRLSGTFDTVEGRYTASASSSLMRYSINGAFDSDGNSLGSTATLLVRESIGSDNWLAFSYIISETDTVIIEGTESTDVVTGGIPAFAQGFWNLRTEFDGNTEGVEVTTFESRLLLTQWTIVEEQTITDPDGSIDVTSFSASVIEAENKGGHWDIIFGVPFYSATDAQARAAVQRFLTETGLTAEERDFNDRPGGPNFWDPSPPWIQEYLANYVLEPLPPWWAHLENWDAVWGAHREGTLPPIPAQYAQYSFYFNHFYGTDFPWIDEWLPLPWWNGWVNVPEPLPPWLQSLGSWDEVYSKQKFNIPAIPSQWQQYAAWYNGLYGTDFDDWGSIPPWLDTWHQGGNVGTEPLPPWLAHFVTWEAVYATQYFDIPAIPSQYQQYAWYYNHLYGTNFAPPRPPPPPPGDLFYTIENGYAWFWSDGLYDWSKINRWYTGNFLERYLIEIGVTPVVFFMKMRATFSNNNSQMTLQSYEIPYEDEGGTEWMWFFETVQEARDVTTLNTDEEGITLTR
jgi:hypothetical protein